jgi:ribosomal protein S9
MTEELTVNIKIGGNSGQGFGVTKALAEALVACCPDKIEITESK